MRKLLHDQRPVTSRRFETRSGRQRTDSRMAGATRITLVTAGMGMRATGLNLNSHSVASSGRDGQKESTFDERRRVPPRLECLITLLEGRGGCPTAGGSDLTYVTETAPCRPALPTLATSRDGDRRDTGATCAVAALHGSVRDFGTS